MRKLLQRVCLGTGVVAVLAAWFVPAAEAGGLKAQIYMVQTAIPGKLTEKGLLGFAKSHKAKHLRESDGELAKRKWKGSMIVAFNAPVVPAGALNADGLPDLLRTANAHRCILP